MWSFPPGDSKTDFVSDRQDPLQVLGAEGTGLSEGDAGGKALNDDRVGVVLDPLVRHLDGVLNAQCLPILPVEQILDLLSQRVGQVDPGQLGLQALWRRETKDTLKFHPFKSLLQLLSLLHGLVWKVRVIMSIHNADLCYFLKAASNLSFKVSWRWN